MKRIILSNPKTVIQTLIIILCNYYSNVNLIFIGLNGSVGRFQCPEENKTGKMNFLNKAEYTPKPSSF